MHAVVFIRGIFICNELSTETSGVFNKPFSGKCFNPIGNREYIYIYIYIYIVI